MHHEFQTDDPVNSFSGVWKRVITEPRAFFQDMPITGGLPAPLGFLAICLGLCALGFLIFGPRGWTLRIIIEGILRSLVYGALLTVVARNLFASGDGRCRPPMPVNDGAIAYDGWDRLDHELEDFTAALADQPTTEAFLPAVSPGKPISVDAPKPKSRSVRYSRSRPIERPIFAVPMLLE